MWERIVKLWRFASAMVKWFLLLPLAGIRYHGKHIWLICERGNDARDNGYHMFRYLRTKHPETDVWYIITKDSADLRKVLDLGNVVFSGTIRHWLLYIRAEKILTAFEPHFSPSGSYSFYRFIRKRNRQKIIFLQHGVIANDLPLYHQERSGFDLFICGAKPEYDFISSTFNYRNGEVRYTGLARFDALHNLSVRRQLLIMPTYRKWFKEQTESEVISSEYVRRWQGLLNNPGLSELAEKYNYDVVFYPHQLMQKYVSLFTSPSRRIVVADYRHYDVQPLLMESAMLVTDYSSIHFDFAYMGKPLLYYQFDEKEVFEKQFGHGYFGYRESGFGEVVSEENNLVNLLEGYFIDGLKVKPFYRKRVEGFFPLHDDHNCDRIYEEILSL